MRHQPICRILCAAALATACVASADDASPPVPLQARVVVKSNSAARPYDRMIFGGFLEHFDNQVYGGIFDPGSPLADAQGFRNDVIEALRELKTPIIRWPGGCFVDSYRWRNGVGAERTHFHVMAMYANLLEERVVDSHITAEPLTDGSHSVAVIDAIATIDASGKRRAVALINRHPQRSVICTLRIGNLMLDELHPATVLHADSADAFNDITHPDRVAPRQAELRFQNNTTTLPPHSLTIVTLAAPPQEGRGNQ